MKGKEWLDKQRRFHALLKGKGTTDAKRIREYRLKIPASRTGNNNCLFWELRTGGCLRYKYATGSPSVEQGTGSTDKETASGSWSRFVTRTESRGDEERTPPGGAI